MKKWERVIDVLDEQDRTLRARKMFALIEVERKEVLEQCKRTTNAVPYVQGG